MVLKEATRQWCDGFSEFFYEIFEQKEEYKEQVFCNDELDTNGYYLV